MILNRGSTAERSRLSKIIDGPQLELGPGTYSGCCCHFTRSNSLPSGSVNVVCDTQALGLWRRGALGELRATLIAQDVLVAGTAGGIYDDDLFAHEYGQATAFIPYVGEIRAIGRVYPTVIPAAELAFVTNQWPFHELDLSYGALATHVARHELGVDGPIREYYTVADPTRRTVRRGRPRSDYPYSPRGSKRELRTHTRAFGAGHRSPRSPANPFDTRAPDSARFARNARALRRCAIP